MSEQERRIVYMMAQQCSVLTKKQVLVEDAVKLFGEDKHLIKQLNSEILMTVPEDKNKKYVFSVLKVIEVLSKKHSNTEFVNLAENEFIVEYKKTKKENFALEIAKTFFVCLAVFFGSAFTIMTFNQDVAVADTFRLFEELVLGPGVESKVMEITYSVGLPLGVIVFFNHFSKAKLDSDPTPLQVQMRLYEDNVNKAVIENAVREGKMKDAD